MIKYLEDLLIADKTVTFLEISHFDHFYGAESNKNKREHMVLDKAALDHLQIFEVDDYTKAVEGSLFHMFKCSFIFGRRLLRKWFAAPLCNKEKLKQRHDAVEYLVDNYKLIQRFRKEMKITYDLEQWLQSIYKFWVMSESRAVYVNINLANQLNYFHILLDQFEKIIGKLNKIFPDKSIIKAKRLRNLLSFNTKDTKNFEAESKKSSNRFTMTSENDEEEIKWEIDFDRSENHGILPDIRDDLAGFKSVLIWNNKVPEPVPGLDAQFDAATKENQAIKKELQRLLNKEQRKLGSEDLEFYTGSKIFRYEINVPNKLLKNVPERYISTSSSTASGRFQTDELKEIIERLELSEEKRREWLAPFLRKLFKKFYKNRQLWSGFLYWIAEIDWLISLAETSHDEPNMVRPEIINSEKPFMEFKSLRHPLVSRTIKNFQPNDIIVGGDDPSTILITGQNMGGKSTLLRQVWLAVVLAWVGCYVPAKSAKITLVDRIFTRIGANDSIIDGKSTFFKEMEETKSIVEQATSRSLVIIDELGRGTSTFDGYSIAHAVLTYLVKHNFCITFFTTHYHMLVDAFANNPSVQPMKMD